MGEYADLHIEIENKILGLQNLLEENKNCFNKKEYHRFKQDLNDDYCAGDIEFLEELSKKIYIIIDNYDASSNQDDINEVTIDDLKASYSEILLKDIKLSNANEILRYIQKFKIKFKSFNNGLQLRLFLKNNKKLDIYPTRTCGIYKQKVIKKILKNGR